MYERFQSLQKAEGTSFPPGVFLQLAYDSISKAQGNRGFWEEETLTCLRIFSI